MQVLVRRARYWYLSMDGMLGLAGWQWLFLLEGIPAVAFGFVVLFRLPDTPADARWLNPQERAWLVSRIRHEQALVQERHTVSIGRALLHPIVWQLGAIMFLSQAANYGLTLWVPQIMKNLSGVSDLAVGLISAIPYFAAAIGMVLIAAHSDRTQERFFHVAIPTVIGAIGFAASAWLTSPVPGMIALTITAIGELGSRGPFWTLPGRFLVGRALAGSIALINTLGALGGFAGSYVVGLMKSGTGRFTEGLLVLSFFLILSAVITLALRRAPVVADQVRR